MEKHFFTLSSYHHLCAQYTQQTSLFGLFTIGICNVSGHIQSQGNICQVKNHCLEKTVASGSNSDQMLFHFLCNPQQYQGLFFLLNKKSPGLRSFNKTHFRSKKRKKTKEKKTKPQISVMEFLLLTLQLFYTTLSMKYSFFRFLQSSQMWYLILVFFFPNPGTFHGSRTCVSRVMFVIPPKDDLRSFGELGMGEQVCYLNPRLILPNGN